MFVWAEQPRGLQPPTGSRYVSAASSRCQQAIRRRRAEPRRVRTHTDALMRKARVCDSPSGSGAFSLTHLQSANSESQVSRTRRLRRNLCPRLNQKLRLCGFLSQFLSRECMNNICIQRPPEHSDSGCDKTSSGIAGRSPLILYQRALRCPLAVAPVASDSCRVFDSRTLRRARRLLPRRNLRRAALCFGRILCDVLDLLLFNPSQIMSHEDPQK